MPRNSSGVYTLPAGNPVVSGTTITSTWANNTNSDLGSEMTNSLDRSGRGGMLAALLGIDGATGTPQYSFTNEPTTGMWRNGAGKLGFSILGSEVFELAAAGASSIQAMGFPLGTAPLPSLFFNGDPNTGMWSPGADTIGWSTGGVEVARMLSTGGLILGGTTPVTASTGANKVISINATTVPIVEWLVGGVSKGNILATTAEFRLNSVAVNPITLLIGNGEAARLDSTGFFGVGTSGPIGKIHASTTGGATSIISQTSLSNDASFRSKTALGDFLFGTGIGVASNVWNVYDLAATAERMRIDSVGNAGIGGGTTAGFKLLVTDSSVNAAIIGIANSSGTGNTLNMYAAGATAFSIPSWVNSGVIEAAGSGGLAISAFAGSLKFQTNSRTTQMTISSGGAITDQNGFELGYKDAVQFLTTGAYTLVIGDRGKCITMNVAGAVTIPSGVFAGGSVVSIYNNLGASGTITQGAGLTLRFGTGTPSTGSRTLANNGMCTLYFINNAVAVLTGSGVS